jgi:trk system potassium uptake protein
MPFKTLKNNVAEWLNNLLYPSKNRVMQSVAILKVIIGSLAICLLLYIFGFELESRELRQVMVALDIILLLYLSTFLVRFVYAFRRFEFLRTHKFEGLLVIIIMMNAISNYFFESFILDRLFRELGFKNYVETYISLIAIYYLILVGYDLIRISDRITYLKYKPSTIFIISFLIFTFIGAGLLMLPAMTTIEGSMNWLDALFTSVSAICVTGLIVVDTPTFFTTKGHIVLMVLMQIGGLGILSFASFFAVFIKSGVGLKQQLMLQDFLSSENLYSVKGLLKQILWITFIIEGLTFMGLMLTWSDQMVFESFADRAFHSLFFAISAFCNAGFSLTTDSLYDPLLKDAYLFHMVIVFSVIMGGIGFPVIKDLFSRSALRERLKSPWKEWQLSTKIAVYTSAFLTVFGMIVIYLLEYDRALADKNFMEALIDGFFQAAAARTAGFATFDMASASIPTLILLMIWMFIGASSGSVGGGIKTSTFFLMMASVYATIRGRMKIEVGKKFIPKELLFKALSIFFFAAGLNAVGIFLLAIFEPNIPISDLMFEHVSAFGTVGLSTGITASLSEPSKLLIISSMFFGRVGILTFALALSSRISSKSYKYPKAHLMVG